MKILLMGGLACGGAEHQMVIIAKELSKRGFDVFFATPDCNGFFRAELEKSKVRIIEILPSSKVGKLKPNILFTIWNLYKFVKKEHIKVGCSFLGSFNFANCVLAMLIGKKYRAITGLRNARESLLLSMRERFYSKFERFSSLKVCNSENARRLYSKYFPQYKNKLEVVYNIVDLPTISSDYQGKKNDKIHFVVPASYREVKNAFGLLEALKLFSVEELSKFDITWYGDTNHGTLPYFVKLKEDVYKHNLQNVFFLKDATNDIANVMNMADVIALFSSSEGLPNAICEGMMLGKPIVMTKVSDYNVLVDQHNGFLCDWDDFHSIKDALCSFLRLSNDDLLRMGDASRKKAFELFSKECNIRKWRQIIKTT